MKILIILGNLLFFFFFSTVAFGEVKVSVDKPLFAQGDEVTLQIVANGDDIEFPKLENIYEFKIVGTHISEKRANSSEDTVKTKTIEYTFTPNRTITTPQLKVKVDNEIFTINPIEIKKIEPKISQKEDNLQLLFEVSKTNIFVGEPIIASIIFKYKLDVEMIDKNIEPFFGDNFFIKELSSSKPIEQNGFMISSSYYLLVPKKQGEIILQNQLINVATREKKTNFKIWQRVFSDIQKITISELPKGISYQGEYTIKATVDTAETTKDTPINLTLEIEGFGNIDDIAPFNLILNNQLIFTSKPTIQTYLKNGKYGGIFTQKFSISSEEDFEIPSFKLEYFDGITKSLKQIATQPLKITIKGDEEDEITSPSAIKEIKTITKEKTKIEENKEFHMEYIDWLLGFLMGCLVTYIVIQKTPKVKKKEELSLEEKIKKAKKEKELFDILLPYSQDQHIATFIKQLEGNIYLNQKNKIDKKALLELFNPLKDEEEDI